MTRKIIFWVFLFSSFFTSCKKIALKTENSNPSIATTTFPSYFSWAISRNVKLTLNITDLQFGNLKYLINIYDGDPGAGGALLCKGSASIKKPFISTVYLDKKYSALYVVKISPNNSRSVQLIEVGNADITASMGARVSTPVPVTDHIPSRFVF